MRRYRALKALSLGVLSLLLAEAPALARVPAESGTKPLQFMSGGHVLGFTAKDLTVATGSHALRVEFVGTGSVVPEADGAAATSDDKAAPLGRVTYPGLWDGITLAYDAPAGALLRSTYTVAAGADPAQIRLRYNAPLQVEPGGGLRVAFATGTMRESAPVAWQDLEGRRVPVAVAFRAVSGSEVGFTVGDYDRSRPLTILSRGLTRRARSSGTSSSGSTTSTAVGRSRSTTAATPSSPGSAGTPGATRATPS